jgi:GcrA cell cycle regulator
MRGEWDDDQVELLKRLWAAGETAQAISAKLGDISRSAVLGKIFRLRLDPVKTGKTPNTPAAAPDTKASTARRRGGIAPEHSQNAKTERKGRTLFELTNDCCRWPYRRPGTEKYFFCSAAGADLEAGVPYCPRHMKRAYLVPPPRVVEMRRRSALIVALIPRGKTDCRDGSH